ncbi:hypothetical protein D3C76_1180160 [compost metagenome]
MAAQQRRIGTFTARWQCCRATERRIDQHLGPGQHLPGITQGQAQRGGKIAAGAVTDHQPPTRVDGKGGGCQMAPHGEAIVQPGWKRMLWRQPIIHRHHQHAKSSRQLHADEVMGVQVPHHPATAMQIEEARPAGGRRCTPWVVGAHSHAGQFEILDGQRWRACRGERPAHLAVGLAQTGEAVVRAVEALGFVDEG